jgi:hypothetical protein
MEQNTKSTTEKDEKFTLEYPLNYNEIVERKMKKIDEEYADVKNRNISNEEAPFGGDLESESNCSESGDKKVEENNYYQCLNNEEEFVEVEEYNNEDNPVENNDETKVEKYIKELEFEFISVEDQLKQSEEEQAEKKDIPIPRSPVKNPEKIKDAMKKIQIKPPKWAQNLSDNDFVNLVKAALTK